MEKGWRGEPPGDSREQGRKQQQNKKHANKSPHIKINENSRRKVPEGHSQKNGAISCVFLFHAKVCQHH
jgi:hypothetical protein